MPVVVALEVVELSRITVEDAEVVETGLAVVAETFGQGARRQGGARRHLGPRPAGAGGRRLDARELRGINPSLAAADLPLLSKAVRGRVRLRVREPRGARGRPHLPGGRPAGQTHVHAHRRHAARPGPVGVAPPAADRSQRQQVASYDGLPGRDRRPRPAAAPRDPGDIAADYGLPINPKGLAQLIGGLTDAIATTLRAGLHLDRGLFLEGSYSSSTTPSSTTPSSTTPGSATPAVGAGARVPAHDREPGGAGELGVAAVGAVANDYARATRTEVRSFPIIFPVDFTPFPKGTGSTRPSAG
jgi:hypothetical protein